MPFLLELIRGEQTLGVDSSVKLLELGKNTGPSGLIDLAFCNGVFHHIPVSERGIAVN